MEGAHRHLGSSAWVKLAIGTKNSSQIPPSLGSCPPGPMLGHVFFMLKSPLIPPPPPGSCPLTPADLSGHNFPGGGGLGVMLIVFFRLPCGAEGSAMVGPLTRPGADSITPVFSSDLADLQEPFSGSSGTPAARQASGPRHRDSFFPHIGCHQVRPRVATCVNGTVPKHCHSLTELFGKLLMIQWGSKVIWFASPMSPDAFFPFQLKI